MPSTFPTTLDSFPTNKADGTAMVVDHAATHNLLADAINKIELYARVYATKTVAPANFPFPELADYQCDGTADQVQIQAAIDALPANDGDVYTSGLTTGGGRVVLLPGVYHLSAGISVDCDLAELVGFGRENTRLVADSGFSGSYMIRFERNPGGGGPYYSGYINWSGTDAQLWLKANRGYPTEMRGSGASIAAGTSSTTVTHGLPYIPSVVQLTPTADTQGRRWWVSATGASTFTISLDANATTNPITFYWRAFYTSNG